ncbi:PSD1 and planctomycete cytochrome C domain-containing protein [Limnoglobus roseus]|uniref:Cytochrome c domain-containing protein n=1 Tax=Limnoglobus roseus TaxID=2598579 RepID=A0A5C1A9Z5_9BACT|nr:PSD1 and planctomycete cytochrome C domain-containing protein [Limnoglobus roseus]QEL15003.1 hypothetical protein PX52LOC_01908 [Limnoglobus roseus]
MHRLLVPTLLAVVALLPRAAADDAFEKTVRPILTESCLRCHGPDKQKGGLRVDSREALLSGGESGPAVVPGQPADSLLVKALHHDDLKMPPAKKLPDEQIAALTQWVKDGAKWGAAKTGGAAGHAARKPGNITDADRAWWAFQPPKRVDAPKTGHPIDAFLTARLEKEGLSPAAEADRHTLVRRVTFDLTGLPPTPDEVAAFVEDQSADAYEKLVDRLLASPRYGERQARAWLDLVRYAESDGYRADFARPHAWKYRDYVVRAFNADKGYDRFLTEQLAGDETFPGDPDALVATGFLRMWPYEYNQRDVRGQWAAIQNDLTDVAADAVLGLGMGCARCHDHKFDPILQKDYFALQAFFAGLRFADEPVFADSAARAEHGRQLAAWEEKTAALRTQIDALLDPVRKKEMESSKRRFPPDIEAVLDKPAADRTPGEQQLYDLAYRQVQYEYDRAPTKLKAQQKTEYERLKKELDALAEPPSPLAMVSRDLGPIAAETVVPGGRKKAVPVEPAFPTVLGQPPPLVSPSATSTGRRAALAKWLTRPDHPLTARVAVNRLWQGHFGVGLVATPSDFGTLGEKPTHPELLDWLAVELVEHGWSLKHLHRLVVTSAAYRRASVGAAKTADVENRLLGRMTVRRLDAEQARDAMLAVSGELKLDAGGPAVPADKPRRSVYTRAHRNAPDALLASFDAADGLSSCARRNVTVTPTQSLLLLNGPGPLARAAAFAARVMPADGKDLPKGVDAAYRLAFGRPPTPTEAAAAREFLRQQVGVASGKAVTPDGRKKAWTDFCHALLNANEFLYVD